MELFKKFPLLVWVLGTLLVGGGVSVNPNQIPSFSAITPRLKILKRGERFTPSFDCEHHYIDHVSLLNARPSRFAKTSMHLKTPAITLEDIESYLTGVTCSGTSMALIFIDNEALQYAKTQWEEYTNILFITAHEGCNPAGSRTPYLASLASEDRDTNTLEFSSQSVPWDEAYDTIEISSGVSTEGDDYEIGGLRQHAELFKRQDEAISISIDIDPTVLLKDSAIYPELPSTSSETSSTDSQGGISFSILGNKLIQDLKCIDCSLLGNISLVDITSSDSSTWSLKAIANSVSAHIEIEANLRPRVDAFEFNVPLKTISLNTFAIAGIAVVAPKIVIEVFGKITASADVDVSLGFEVTIPDGSYIELTSDGKTDFSLTTSGFISNPAITPIIGLRFNFLLSVSPIAELAPSIYAGVYIELPKLSADFEFVTDTNILCETIDSTETDPELQIAFPNLLNIQPSASMAVGGAAGVGFESTEFVFSDLKIGKEIAAVSFPLSNLCLEWYNGKGEERVEGFNAPGINGAESVISGTETGIATRTAAGVTAITEAGGPVTSVASGGKTSGNAPAKTSSLTPSRTSGAAAETSRNSASGKMSKLSEQSRFTCAAGVLTVVFLFVGTVL
ncbi:hypothetical protein IFR05_014936 [Cadophora sp. M221]|nr:hypothetical protein IFR05_014936 [Cadophora sp. M221]